MVTDDGFWDQTPEQKQKETLEKQRLEARTITERLEDQFNLLKDRNIFTAIQHNILKDDIQEIWTSFLLKDGEDIGKRLNALSHNIPTESYEKIFSQFCKDTEINDILTKEHKSVLLNVDPQYSSQEAVESFLGDTNNKYDSKFTLEDFDLYARNRVFADADQELIGKRKIEFGKKYDNDASSDSVIPQKITLEALESKAKTEAILEGFLNKDAPTLITASGGTGKSALTLNMVLALGSSDTNDWLGFKKGKTKYTSMIVQQEDSQHTITERLRLMCQDPAMKRGIDSLFFIGNNFKVTSKSLSADGDDSLIDYITANLKSMFISGNDIPDLLILDSLSVFAGASENDSMSMRGVMHKLFSLCSKFNMTPIVIHHHGKDLKYRGSSAIVESVRCHYTLRSVGGEKADKIFKDLEIGETVHLNKIERPKANDLYGNFNLTYICNNMMFKTIDQAMEAVGKTPERKINDRLQKIRDIVEDKVFGAEELTKLIMEQLEVKERTAKSGISAAVDDEYILREKIGRNNYYFTNDDDFEEFKESHEKI